MRTSMEGEAEARPAQKHGMASGSGLGGGGQESSVTRSPGYILLIS